MIIAFFKNLGGIYNNFWHEKWICYDKRVSKIRGQYIKEKSVDK